MYSAVSRLGEVAGALINLAAQRRRRRWRAGGGIFRLGMAAN